LQDTGTPRQRAWYHWLLVLGPGLMVMLADTDAGSVITAAQSGAQWGYSLLLPQILLIPILFGIQEVTVRLGIITRQGHGALIRERFGLGWAVLSAATLFVACMGALITEFSGIAGAGELFGLPRVLTIGCAVALLLALVLTGSYTQAERAGIAMGMLELLFIPAALLAHPSPGALKQGLLTVPLSQPSYVFLLAANVGAVIMPWMIFYQQGAVVDKGLRRADLPMSRWDTLGGAILTQVVMAAVLVSTAATTLGAHGAARSLATVGDIARALAPFPGWNDARLLFGLGLVGAAFVAALVVSLAGAWGICEVFGWRHSLNDPVPHARRFYWLYALAVLGSALMVVFSANLINLAVDIEVLNAMLLPIVLGFLLALEATVLPVSDRMHGWWRYSVWLCAVLVMALGIYITATVFGSL
jgi:Mn2+/Fe2+ NRAMP family transporter